MTLPLYPSPPVELVSDVLNAWKVSVRNNSQSLKVVPVTMQHQQNASIFARTKIILIIQSTDIQIQVNTSVKLPKCFEGNPFTIEKNQGA